MEFSKTFKLYVFKDKGTSDLTIKVSEQYAQTFNLPTLVLQEMLDNYSILGKGFDKEINGSYWLVQLKMQSPEPRIPCAYVRISVYHNGIGHQYRISPDDMIELKKDLFYQLHNKMYWDIG